MTLTKAEIADKLNQDLHLPKRDAKDLVDLFFEAIRQTLQQGRNVKLSGFGNFNLRDKSSRPGRNPKTGQPTSITARRVVTFRAGQKLRANIKEYFSQQKKLPKKIKT